MSGRSCRRGGGWKVGCKLRGSRPEDELVVVRADDGARAVDVDDDEENEQPDEREQPEKETLRM